VVDAYGCSVEGTSPVEVQPVAGIVFDPKAAFEFRPRETPRKTARIQCDRCHRNRAFDTEDTSESVTFRIGSVCEHCLADAKREAGIDPGPVFDCVNGSGESDGEPRGRLHLLRGGEAS
jgi:hypothetical protein